MLGWLDETGNSHTTEICIMTDTLTETGWIDIEDMPQGYEIKYMKGIGICGA